MIPVDVIQSYYDQAEQYRRDRFTSEFKFALQKHFFEKARDRIPELAAALIKKTFPPVANALANLTSQVKAVQLSLDEPSEWKELIQLTENLRIKAGIIEPVYPCTSDVDQLAAWGNYIMLSSYLNSCSKMQQEFMIMHELMHMQLSHLNVRIQVSYFFALADLLCLYYCIPLIFCVEVFAFYLESSISRYQEMQADLEAIDKLGTNAGAIETYQSRMDKICVLHFPDNLSPHQIEDLRKIQQIACDFSEVTHPSATERLRYCKEKKVDLPV